MIDGETHSDRPAVRIFFQFHLCAESDHEPERRSLGVERQFRYGYMILLLTAWLLAFRGAAAIVRTLGLFFNHLAFWVAAGSIGFGAFYALICFSVDYAPGWIVATTWQFTIIATLVVLTAFGRRFPRRIWLFSTIVFAGVFLVNISQAGAVDPRN
jgi:drug/metabolite transporter (DMT)-like permease